MQIGIPKALLYYQYYPMWKTFFEGLGAQVVTSSATTEEMVRVGCSRAMGEVCLPVKVFCGHAWSLAGKCDYLFIPAVHAMQPGVYNCPKFIGLPDLVRALVPECPPIVDPDINLNLGPQQLRQNIRGAVSPITTKQFMIDSAARSSVAAHKAYLQKMVADSLCYPEAIDCLSDGSAGQSPPDTFTPTATIAVVGHPYIIHDRVVNRQLKDHLTGMKVKLVFSETVGVRALRTAALDLVEQPYWGYEEDIVGASSYFLRQDVDGIITVVAFGCGPDSMMLALVQGAARRAGKPMLNIVLDEHTAAGGLITRLEAFVDMLSNQKRSLGRPFHIMPRNGDQYPIAKVGIPNLGLVAPAFRRSAETLNLLMVAPPVSSHTLSLGTRHSPEFACLPFKVILGTFIEALEMGAESLFMVTSSNACRMGYYTRVHEEILRDLGYRFQFLNHPSSKKGIADVLKTIKGLTDDAPWLKIIDAYRLGTSKLKALDDLERRMERLRPIVVDKGGAERLFHDTIRAIDAAPDMRAFRSTVRDHFRRLDRMPRDGSVRPLKVGLVGEIFVIMEPFVNLNVESELGRLGVEVVRNRSTFFSEYTRPLAYLNVLNKDKKRLARYACPYMNRDVGGHGLESLAEKAHLASAGYDGLVHVIPFTCMPETIAQNIMPRVDVDLPVLTIVCDEQTTRTGMLTRLEAFVDLLEYRRRKGYTRVGVREERL